VAGGGSGPGGPRTNDSTNAALIASDLKDYSTLSLPSAARGSMPGTSPLEGSRAAFQAWFNKQVFVTGRQEGTSIKPFKQ